MSLGYSYTISAATEMRVEMLRGWRAWHSRAKALTLWTLARSSGKTSTCSAETFFALFSLVERILFLSPPERISCRDASPRLSSRQPMTTVAPSDMSLLATALPIPEVAPVMTTVAPLRSRKWCGGSFGRCCSRYQALAPRATAGTPTMVAPAARRSRDHMCCLCRPVAARAWSRASPVCDRRFPEGAPTRRLEFDRARAP